MDRENILQSTLAELQYVEDFSVTFEVDYYYYDFEFHFFNEDKTCLG